MVGVVGVEALPVPAGGPSPAAAAIEAEWTAADGQEREGSMKGPGGWASHLQGSRVPAAMMSVRVCVHAQFDF